MTERKTLGQAIDDILAAPVGSDVEEKLKNLALARQRLDGLEESRAVIEARARAYEHATALARQAGEVGRWTPTHERVLEVAQFLAPVWEELEDPLGPNSTTAELEESEAHAVARADELVDEVARLERYLVQAQDQNRLLTQKVEHRDALLASANLGNVEMDLVIFNGQPWAMRKELAVEWRRMVDQFADVEAKAI